jgi:hypothetical protein
VAGEQNEVEAVLKLVDAVFDGDAGHRRSLLALELMSGKSRGSYPLPDGISSFFVLVWPQPDVREPAYGDTATVFSRLRR